MNRFYSLQYEIAGIEYAMHIYATEQEAEQHALNLNAISCEPLTAIVDADFTEAANETKH